MALCVLVILICFHADTLTLAAACMFDEDLHLGANGFHFAFVLGDQHFDIFNDDAVAVISKLKVEVAASVSTGLLLGRKNPALA